MNRTMKRILTLTLALIVCLSLMPAAMAIEASNTGGPTAAEFTKNLIMNSDAKLPQAKFNFKLSATSVDDPAFPLFNGVMAGVKVGSMTLADYDAATGFDVAFDGQEAATDGLPGDAGQATAGKKYVSESFSVDFSGVTFPEPGVYRYVLTETAPGSPFYAEANATRYIDVYVEYAALATGGNATVLSIQGILSYMTTPPALTTGDQGGTNLTETANKSTGIDNSYRTYDLTLSKTVSGNQASRSEYFLFKVTVNNPAATDGTVYPTSYAVVITNGPGDSSVDGHTNATSIAAGTATNFYLRHGESIVVQGLPEGATYTVEETTSGYVATATVTGPAAGETVTSGGTASDATLTVQTGTGKGMTADTAVAVTNSRSGAIPTGVLLTIAPFAALMIIGLVGVVVFLKKKHND